MNPLQITPVSTDNNVTENVQSQAWMLTFADLLSLLLTFFVLIFSMNAVQKDEWQEVVQSLTKEFNPTRAQSVAKPEGDVDATRVFRASALNLEYIMSLMRPHLANSPLGQDAKMDLLSDRLVIRFSSKVFFNDMQLSDDATSLVNQLSDVFSQMGNEIRVGVHTDPTQAPAQRLMNKNEYTVMQALAIADALRNAGYNEPVAALGYGDRRFVELDGKLSVVERYSLANRVEISIMDRTGREATDGE